MMQRCERCRAENDDTSTYCVKCGKSIKRITDDSKQVRLEVFK